MNKLSQDCTHDCTVYVAEYFAGDWGVERYTLDTYIDFVQTGQHISVGGELLAFAYRDYIDACKKRDQMQDKLEMEYFA